MAAHSCAALGRSKMGACSPYLAQLRREAQECDPTWSFGKRFVGRFLTNELSQRAACQKYGLGWHTLKKILAHAEPPG